MYLAGKFESTKKQEATFKGPAPCGWTAHIMLWADVGENARFWASASKNKSAFIGAQFWKHEILYIKLELADSPTRDWKELAKAQIALHGLSTVALGLQLSPTYTTLLSQ